MFVRAAGVPATGHGTRCAATPAARRDLPPPLTLTRRPGAAAVRPGRDPGPGDDRGAAGRRATRGGPDPRTGGGRDRRGVESVIESPRTNVRGLRLHFTSSSVPHSDGSSAEREVAVDAEELVAEFLVADGVVHARAAGAAPGRTRSARPPAGTPRAGSRPSPRSARNGTSAGSHSGASCSARLIFVWANAGSSLSGPPPAGEQVELVAVPARPVARPGRRGCRSRASSRPTARGRSASPAGELLLPLHRRPGRRGRVRSRRAGRRRSSSGRRGRRSCSAGRPPAGRRAWSSSVARHRLDVRARVGDADEEPVRDDRRHGGVRSGVSRAQFSIFEAGNVTRKWFGVAGDQRWRRWARAMQAMSRSARPTFRAVLSIAEPVELVDRWTASNATRRRNLPRYASVSTEPVD